MSTYRFIRTQASCYPVRRLCHVLGLAPSAYYAWLSRPAPLAAPTWEQAAVTAFAQHQRRYGTRRLRAELRAQGYAVGRYRLRGVLRRHGLRALQPRRFTPRTTDSTHGHRCAPNHLLGQPRPTHPNRVWVTDITYLPLAGGYWAYLCALQDAATRRVVGWHVAATTVGGTGDHGPGTRLAGSPAGRRPVGPFGSRRAVL